VIEFGMHAQERGTVVPFAHILSSNPAVSKGKELHTPRTPSPHYREIDLGFGYLRTSVALKHLCFRKRFGRTEPASKTLTFQKADRCLRMSLTCGTPASFQS
jgi:hypothetical protein